MQTCQSNAQSEPPSIACQHTHLSGCKSGKSFKKDATTLVQGSSQKKVAVSSRSCGSSWMVYKSRILNSCIADFNVCLSATFQDLCGANLHTLAVYLCHRSAYTLLQSLADPPPTNLLVTPGLAPAMLVDQSQSTAQYRVQGLMGFEKHLAEVAAQNLVERGISLSSVRRQQPMLPHSSTPLGRPYCLRRQSPGSCKFWICQ